MWYDKDYCNYLKVYMTWKNLGLYILILLPVWFGIQLIPIGQVGIGQYLDPHWCPLNFYVTCYLPNHDFRPDLVPPDAINLGHYPRFLTTLPGVLIVMIVLPLTLSSVIFRLIRHRIEMNMKNFVQGIVYLLVYGKLAVTLGAYLPWLVEYSRGRLNGPGWGFFILLEILLLVIIFLLSLILLRFSTRKYRTLILPLILVVLFEIGFIFLNSSVDYSRGW